MKLFKHNNIFKLTNLFILFLSANMGFAQCPTIINNNQIFCDSDLATISSLVAQDNGGGVVWFDSQASITPIPNFQPLTNGTTYYVDDNTSSCGVRQTVTVTILSAPIGPNFQGFCVQDITEATVQNLIAVGLGIQWFTTPFGGVALQSTDILNSGSIYFASQTNPQTGCSSSRLAVFVTIGLVEAPIGDAEQFICFDDPDNPPVVSDLVASGDNNWYISPNATIPLNPLTVLVDGQTYYATTTTPPCESEDRLAVTVTLLDANDAGLDTTFNICESLIGSGGSFNLVELLDGTPSTTGSWVGDLNTQNGGLGTVNYNDLSLANSPYQFTYTVQDNDLCPLATSTLIIVIDEFSEPGDDFNLSICENDLPVDLFSLIPGNPSVGGFWSPALSSGTNIFDPAVDLSGDYVYTVNTGTSCPVLTSTASILVTETPDAGESNTVTICNNIGTFELTTLLLGTPELTGTWEPPLASGTNTFDPLIDQSGVYTYTIVSGSTCPDSFSILNLTIETAAYAGEDAVLDFCDNDAPVDLRTLLGGNPDLNGTWSPALASGTNTFIPSVDVSGTYTYTVIGNASCGDDSAVLEITIQEAPDAGISNSITICFNDEPLDLFETLNGNPDLGGVWTPALTNPGFFDPTLDTPGIFTYTVSGFDICEDVQATVNVQIEANPNAGVDSSITICDDEAPFDLLNFMDGNPDTGGFWTPALVSGTNIFDPQVDISGVYTYTVSGQLNCSDDSSDIAVNIVELLNAGTDAQLTLCSTDSPIDLFTILGGNPDIGGVWSPALASGSGIFNPQIDNEGLYTYSISGNGICPDQSATVLVEIVLPPNAGDNGNIVICSSAVSFDLRTLLGGNPDLNGVWSPALASGTNVFNPSVDNSGIYTYTVTASNACGQDQSQVDVTVFEAANSGLETVITICEGNPPINLTDALNGNPDAGGVWSPALASGSDIFDPALDSAGIYWYVIQAEFPCENTATMLTVTIVPELHAGVDESITLCSSDSPVNLFNILGGSPQQGGTWSPELASVTGVFDPQIDNAGDYTYTVFGNEFCLDATATITVQVFEEPDAGISDSIIICENESLFDLTNLLGPTVQSNGTWSPALQSGTNIFNPALDVSGVYTYTVTGSGPCADATSTVTITVEPLLEAGQSNQIGICSDGSPINLFDVLIGSPDSNGVWSPALASGSGIFDPTLDSEGFYTYTVSGNGICPDSEATIEVTIQNQSNPGESQTVTLCESSDPLDLFTILGGNPDENGVWSPNLTSGTGLFDPSIDLAGVYSYTFQATGNCEEVFSTVTVILESNPDAGQNGNVTICENDATIDLFTILNGTPDAGGVWSPALNSGSGIFDPTIDSGGVYTYTLNANTFCSESSATVTVNLIPEQSAGEDGSITICQNSAVFDLTTVLGGSPVSGGTWSPELSTSSDIFDPSVDGSGLYTYTVITPCGVESAVVTVTIELIPQPGENGLVTICANGAPINLFDLLGGNPELGGVWTPALLSGDGIFNPLLDLPGVYTYTLSGSPTCGDQSATVTVSLEQPVNPGVSNEITICQNSSNINLFNLLGNTATAGGTWSPALTSGTNFYNPQNDGEGIFTYIVGGTDICNPSEATVTVNFIPGISSGVFSGLQQVCENETTFDLFSLLDGSQTTGGIWLNNMGTIISNVIDPSQLAIGTYPFVYLISNSCLSTSTIVQLQIIAAPNLIQNNIGIDTPICVGESASILVSSLPDGTYQLGIEGLGENIFAETNFEVVVSNGFGILTIPAALLPNFGLTSFQFNNITNTITGCSNLVSDVLIQLEILQTPTINADQISISEICLGDSLVIEVLNANQLIDGDYIFQYEITGPNTFISESETIIIQSGQSSFEIDGLLFNEVGDFTFNILQLLNTNTGCVGAIDVTIPFVINSLPLDIQPIVSFENPFQCINQSNTVFIDFGFGLFDDTFDITYTLSGVVTFSETINVTTIDGIASIFLPDTILENAGTVTFTLDGFLYNSNFCGDSFVLSATQDFVIESPISPELVLELLPFCEEESPTLAILSDYVFANGLDIIWYDSSSGGNILPFSTLLENGFTYYATAVTANGCESLDRLSITVIVEPCIVDIRIPDGFSPNNDGINDTFEIVNIRELFPNFSIEIFNRYGNVVFRGDASKDDWDGHNNQGGIKFNNNVLPNGVYFYILNFNDGVTGSKQGRVYLNR
uniref:Ig-like domain-containing protein n=3 Tax=Flavobacterium sp. TaxID=239 RepID=UPI00404A6411